MFVIWKKCTVLSLLLSIFNMHIVDNHMCCTYHKTFYLHIATHHHHLIVPGPSSDGRAIYRSLICSAQSTDSANREMALDICTEYKDYMNVNCIVMIMYKFYHPIGWSIGLTKSFCRHPGRVCRRRDRTVVYNRRRPAPNLDTLKNWITGVKTIA